MKNNKLLSLAEKFAPYAPLYAVGGCVRDDILNIQSGDIDVCASLDAAKVREFLKGTEFTVQNKDLRMGTIVITSHGFKAEYTTFRVDSYKEGSGKHRPDTVKFTDDIKEDALRRDFTCNSLYLDILKNELVDLVGGVDDINNKVIKTVTDPNIVFEADGLRILRMVRFAVELGFSIDPKTWQVAKDNVWRIKDLSPERILVELDKIFVADTAHGRVFERDGFISAYAGKGNDGSPGVEGKDETDILHNAHFIGIKMLDELGVLEILFPELTALKGLKQSAKWHIYDAYDHSLEAYRVSVPEIRWAALFHDIGKKPSMDKYGKMYMHAIMGADMMDGICNRLRFPKIRARDICALIRNHMYDIDDETSESKLRWFMAEKSKLMPQLIDLKAADTFASQKIRPELRWAVLFEQMKQEGVPMGIKDLKVNGDDLIAMGYPECERGMALYELWRDTVMNNTLNDRDHALEYLRKKIKK